jgi:hypothetical protein
MYSWNLPGELSTIRDGSSGNAVVLPLSFSRHTPRMLVMFSRFRPAPSVRLTVKKTPAP